jgi:hypothetical protein
LPPNALARLWDGAADIDWPNGIIACDDEVMAVRSGGFTGMSKTEISDFYCVRLYTISQCSIPSLVATA